ncbi:CheY-like chemotaxis protein [Gillisia sp. Hel_I_86]|uniref:response regulator n=1 Tax=Gillisia sp. Hel_I_86 TaxID=1249981 RepID=UPI00119A9ED0|nr:response regulator [Gillisia sp. Hel_I_86]TVZ28453.1 CheY-like chemotaxis protein [Gillisia sp. Hel_I_86]
MDNKLNCILLIDDDEAVNFIHNRVIKKSGCANEVAIARNGQEAIDFLITKVDNKYPQPDLIFLDINMPVMNGWEFLEAYEKLEKEQKGKELIVMLTTSLNPDDKEKAKKIAHINDFHPKPLSVEHLNKILETVL